MDRALPVAGVTFQVRVTDFAAGDAFYRQLLGRAPDLEATETFHEWRLLPSCWLQVAEGAQPMQGRMRLGVGDIEAERARLIAVLGIAITPVERIEGLAAWCNFADPWGNCLGLFQDLAAVPS